MASGVEQYAEVKGNHRTYRHVNEIRGLSSFEGFVTMLSATRWLVFESAIQISRTTGEIDRPA